MIFRSVLLFLSCNIWAWGFRCRFMIRNCMFNDLIAAARSNLGLYQYTSIKCQHLIFPPTFLTSSFMLTYRFIHYSFVHQYHRMDFVLRLHSKLLYTHTFLWLFASLAKFWCTRDRSLLGQPVCLELMFNPYEFVEIESR